MLKRFNKVFGIQDSLEKEQQRFVQRVNQTIFREVESSLDCQEVLEFLCFELGEDADDITRLYDEYDDFECRDLTGNKFKETLKVICLLCDFCERNDRLLLLERIDELVNEILSRSTQDLGVEWKDGMFYPSGAKELDKDLIEEPLGWLDDFPVQKKDFKKAIEEYLQKEYNDVVDNCYLTIEGLARKILDNNKVLKGNREELLRTVGLSQEWKAILDKYMEFAHEFNRHASDRRHEINPTEVEAFLYQTGLLVRLIVESQQ